MHDAPPPVLSARRKAAPRPPVARELLHRWARRPVGARQRLLAIEQLARLLGAGIPLASALPQILAGARNRRLRRALAALRDGIEGGGGVAASARLAGGLFSDAECGLVEVGERTGHLPEVLGRIAVSWRRGAEVRRRLAMGAAYPLLLLLVSVFLMPLPALFVGGAKAYLRACAGGLGWLALGVGVVLAVPAVVRLARLGPVLRRAAWHLPGVRALYRKRVLSDALHTLSTALAAGLGVHESLDLAATATGDPTAGGALRATSRGLAEGREFTEAIGATGLLPDNALVAVAGGERSGTLADAAARLAEDWAKDYQDLLVIVTRVAGVAMLLAVTGMLAVRLLGAATGLLPGSGEGYEQIEREMRGLIRPMPTLPGR